MPTPTYVALAKTVLTGTQATVTFSGIVNTYTDLVLLVSSRDDYASGRDNIKLTINGTSANYSQRIIYGFGTSTGSVSAAGGGTGTYFDYLYNTAASGTSNTFGSTEIYIPNYAGSTNKPISTTSVAENNATDSTTMIAPGALLWSNTAAITSLTLAPALGTNFVSGSRFDLYGIKNS